MREESSREYYKTERSLLSYVAFGLSASENVILLMVISKVKNESNGDI
jgi:hypothetical protein